MKRFTAACLLALAAILPTFALDFSYTYEGNTLHYTVLDETAKTCKVIYAANYPAVSGEVKIPATVKCGDIDYTVVAIDSWAFYRSGMSSISIPASIISIEDSPFENCPLREVKFEDGTETLNIHGSISIYNRTLETIYLGRNITYTGSSPIPS